MFEHLDLLPADPILGLMAEYRADPSPTKLDLGVGVYKDPQGRTPVMAAVRAAELLQVNEQDTKTYLSPAGNPAFNQAIARLVLGAEHPALITGRAMAMQAPGGCGALRLGAELLVAANPQVGVHVSDPTWANHVPLLGSAGLRLARYPYYDARRGAVNFDAMLEALRALPAGEVVLLHGACHNPTGADLSLDQWRTVAQVLAERRLIPFVDLAYQGLGQGLEEDAQGARWLAQQLPEMILAVSCSKNFGLYRERVGALIVITEQPAQTTAAMSHLSRIARGSYSMPPNHGAGVVARILDTPQLRTQWEDELTQMRSRINELRQALSAALVQAWPQGTFAAVGTQQGMFSMLDLPVAAVDRLRTEYGIYMTRDGRINIAGLVPERIGDVAAAIARVLQG